MTRGFYNDQEGKKMTKTVEAKGTHPALFQRPATLDALPEGSVVQDANGDRWRQKDFTLRGTYWENLTFADGEERRCYSIPLPATLVQVPAK